MAEDNSCGEWRDKSITPEQEQRAELITQHEQTIETLQRRIAKAIEVARLQARWPSGEFVEIVEAKALDLVIEILEGKQ